MLFLRTDKIIQSLKDELPTYLIKAADIPDDFDTLTDTWSWWKSIATDLPSWSSAVRKLILIQPSSRSAAAETVFSLLATIFGDQRHETSEDYVEAALMLLVNNR